MTRTQWLIVWISFQVTWVGLLAMIVVQNIQQRRVIKRTAGQIDRLVHLHRFTADMLRTWANSWGGAPETVRGQLNDLIARHQEAARALELQ